MVAFNGIPSSRNGWKTSKVSWKTCLSQCLNDQDCGVVFQNSSYCYVMKRGNITIQTSNSAVNRVAVKIPTAPDDCLPKASSYFNQSFTEIRNESQIIRSEFSYSNGQYRVVYTVSKCPNATDLYTRTVGTETYHVCVGFRVFEGRIGTFYDAQKLCKEDGGYGLTGPLDGNEYAILRDKGIAARKVDGQDRGGYFWIDGLCNHTWWEFDYEDESHNGRTGYSIVSGDPNDNPPTAFFMLWPIGGNVIADYTASASFFKQPWIGALCRVNDVALQD
ncbi:unnamed protein product [Caenorhabditis nigoni]